MWRWLLIVLVIIPLGLWPVAVIGATTQEVTVTATPGYGIVSFNVDYVSDTQIDLSWVVAPDVTNVMVRAKFNADLDEIPDSATTPSDGVLVYYGDASNVSYWTNLETTSYPLYFKVWGQKADESWYIGSRSGWTEGATMLLLALIALALGFFISMFVFKRGILAWASIAAWLVLGAFCYTKYETEWDIYYTIFFLSIGLVFITVVELWRVVASSKGIEPEDELDEEDEALMNDFEGIRKERERYRSIFGNRRRRPKRSSSNYEQTGEH